jgi:hypothetical protein
MCIHSYINILDIRLLVKVYTIAHYKLQYCNFALQTKLYFLKLHLLLILALLLSLNSYSQKIQVVSEGLESDSSFYHVAKIADNEYWAGGEYGILKRIDSLGNVSLIDYPTEGKAILKIERVNNYVFVATDDAIIYRYDLTKKTFLKKIFPAFKNRCFYDFIPLKNGELLLCGGTSGISKGEKKIPHGFIAVVDQDLNDISVVWKCYRKFVWSLLELDNGQVMAATFNGFNTKILSSIDIQNWKKDTKVKGLVHELAIIDNEFLYSGTRSIKFNKNGILGLKNKNNIQTNGTGCLWSMDILKGSFLTVTDNGKVLFIDKKSLTTKQIDTPTPYAIYDIVKISESKILVVGHAKAMFIVDFGG